MLARIILDPDLSPASISDFSKISLFAFCPISSSFAKYLMVRFCVLRHAQS